MNLEIEEIKYSKKLELYTNMYC